MDKVIRLNQLYIYPVKSLKGIELDESVVTEKGLLYDRHWMIVNPKGMFITQRQFPQMALLSTHINNDYLVIANQQSGQSIEVPLVPTKPLPKCEATVWKNKCQVLQECDDVGRWLSEQLKTPWPVRLVRMAEGFTRQVDQSEKFGVGDHFVETQFADGVPFLVANQASLDELNRHLEMPVPMNRFRPNMVIEGLEPFEEHKIKSLVNESIRFDLRYPCERCIVTTVDQKLGTKHPLQEPLKTLIKLNPMPNNNNAAAFAENATVTINSLCRLNKGAQFRLIT